MDAMLEPALEAVVADVRATGAPEPRVEPSQWTGDPALPAAMLWSPDGSGVGIFVRAGDSPAARVAHAAEQVQEWVLEERPPGAPGWPPCPVHDADHALSAAVVDSTAQWVCASDRVVVAPIGALGAPDGG
ncbi:hypothetical protein [Nocardioides sp. zg-DK7169]|uniref:hypothetical protein n=1 Tax=Nocardioides sp. zg-DK7169 TaxID=2736600 RepID=UPI001553D60B|nr:hypothetical protein [Nocardioides sp. zg-DK7169]NPC95303.1 hypothetical protein [Nocardioides sp. zg-DK7169]